jgi:hypothetical protein
MEYLLANDSISEIHFWKGTNWQNRHSLPLQTRINRVLVQARFYAFFFAASSSSDFGTLTKAGTTTLLRFRIAFSVRQQKSACF